jgi:hypothetical protein
MENAQEIEINDDDEVQFIDRTEANAIIARRHGEATDAGYESARKKFKLWLRTNYPQGLSGNDNDPIGMREIELPLERNSTIAFLGRVQKLKLAGEALHEIPLDQPPIAVSTMTSIGSALSDLYKSRNLTMAEDLKSEITKFMKGYRRTINNLKQRGEIDCFVHHVFCLLQIRCSGEMSIFEGKRPISAKGYILLATYALSSADNRLGSVYTHIFTILCWNLFARSCNVGTLMLQHISWENDSLKIVLPKHKGDQEGARIYPKHVFANPLRPEVCPVLGLAIYIFSCLRAQRENRDWTLFAGGKVEAKYSHWLKEILQNDILVNADLGNLAADLGTHSFRLNS